MEKIVNYNEEDLKNHHAVSAIIKNKEGEILIQKHIKYGFWTIPVGKVKSNQSINEALKEEIYEECNIIIDEATEIGCRTDIYNRNGKNVKVTLHSFEIIKYSGEIQNREPDKHKIQEFKNIEDVKKLPYLSDATLFYLHKTGFDRPSLI